MILSQSVCDFGGVGDFGFLSVISDFDRFRVGEVHPRSSCAHKSRRCQRSYSTIAHSGSIYGSLIRQRLYSGTVMIPVIDSLNFIVAVVVHLSTPFTVSARHAGLSLLRRLYRVGQNDISFRNTSFLSCLMRCNWPHFHEMTSFFSCAKFRFMRINCNTVTMVGVTNDECCLIHNLRIEIAPSTTGDRKVLRKWFELNEHT